MNWKMIGHQWAVDLLAQHIARDHIRHAYLITGPRGSGRRTLALRLIQALNCSSPPVSGQPCLTCSTCRRIEQMQHPDLFVVQAEQVGGFLRVDQIRELQHSLSLANYEAAYRAALILRFNEAHLSASNALLKTLEEPSSKVILILTAESAEGLLPTIVSRCEVIRLGPVPYNLVEDGLVGQWSIPRDEARLLAHLSGGRPGYALQLHQQPELLEQRQTWLEDMIRLLRGSRVERFAYADSLSKEKEQTRSALQNWLSLWRDILLRGAGAAAPITNLDLEEEVVALAQMIDVQSARQTMAEIERTLALVDKSVNTRLALEVLFLNMPRFVN